MAFLFSCAEMLHFSFRQKVFNTMFSSYQIVITLFQFLYRIGLLFSLKEIFCGMIFVMERGWNAPILKVIQGKSDSYRSTPKT